MTDVMVVGLFGSKGGADNARHRLHSEGVEKDDIVEEVLSETSAPPRSMDAELAPLAVDPFFGIMGDLRRSYASYITNGETVVCVRASSEREANSIAGILQLFDPVRVDFHSEPAGKGAG